VVAGDARADRCHAAHGTRVDDEDERHGPARIFLFAEPLSGLRPATARARRTKVDWAIEVAQWLETRYVACAKGTWGAITFTRIPRAFDEAFPPERARASVTRMAFCLHAEARQLVARRCMRVTLSAQAMSDRPTHRRTAFAPIRDWIWADKSQPAQSTRGALLLPSLNDSVNFVERVI